MKIDKVYLFRYILKISELVKNTILNLGYLWGLAPPLCVLRNTPVLLRQKGVYATIGSPLGWYWHKEHIPSTGSDTLREQLHF